MPNNAISPRRHLPDFCSGGENPSPACAFFARILQRHASFSSQPHAKTTSQRRYVLSRSACSSLLMLLCVLFVAACVCEIPHTAQRQLRKGSALRRSATVRQRVLHKERVIYHINNTSTINSNSNCLICLICFKVLQGCLGLPDIARKAAHLARQERAHRRSASCAGRCQAPMIGVSR